MSALRTTIIAASAAGLALLCGGGAAAAGVAAFLDSKIPAASTAGKVALTCGAGPAFINVSAAKAVSGWSEDQVTNATTIVTAGQQLTVPPRGWIVAVATAMQESSLRNSAKMTDHDSVGLFQQRPSQGWGTVAQIMDPVYSSRKFYEKLVQIPGWETMPLTKAAQKVQRSAYPNAYAKHEAKAAHLVDAITGGAGKAAATSGECAKPGQVTAGGWTIPVVGAKLGSGFRTSSRPGHQGVDLIVGKHHKVVAATGGTVIVAVCQRSTQLAGGCDRDGSPSTPGCGWYVDLKHAGGMFTRYCHLVSKPLVSAGQHVAAGQQIGWSGTSGHSSGPHLHFEVHRGSPRKDGAIDPVPWMKDHGAPLDVNGTT